ncbi:MAG: LysR family transcriptional regulator [Aestuariibacter sp.]|nr:LysR family transcriptional regulator [Aestuariibacter sp.]
MKKYRRQLPSLDALVFFEAAARHNSFTQAATELYVTQAAVSKRIRELETRLGVILFHRDGRKLALSNIGRRLHERTDMALEYLEDACRLARGEESETIRIAANSAVSLLWLTPRIREFGLGENSASVNLFTSDIVGDTMNPENDLVIGYGYGDTPGWTSEMLFEERLVPVAAPVYLDSLGIDSRVDLKTESKQLQSLVLLEYERLAPDWVNWQLWIDKTQLTEMSKFRRELKQNYAQTIGAALSGQGLALGCPALIENELSSGRLCIVGNTEWTSSRGYYISQPHTRKLSVAAEQLRQRLIYN